MTEIIVNERALNDDVLTLACEGKVFKGNYVAILEYFTYANEWSDSKHVKCFRTLDTMLKFLNKRYPNFDISNY